MCCECVYVRTVPESYMHFDAHGIVYCIYLIFKQPSLGKAYFKLRTKWILRCVSILEINLQCKIISTTSSLQLSITTTTTQRRTDSTLNGKPTRFEFAFKSIQRKTKYSRQNAIRNNDDCDEQQQHLLDVLNAWSERFELNVWSNVTCKSMNNL